MTKQAFLVAVVSLITTAAFAKGDSEFWFRPKGGQGAVTLGVKSFSYKVEAATAGTKVAEVETTSMPINLAFEYGLNESNAIGFYFDFGTDKAKTTLAAGGSSETKSTGMSNVTLTYSGASNALQYGANLGISPSKNKEPSTTQDGNRYSGGMSLEPYVGYHHALSGSAVGVKLSYSYKMERTTVTQGTPDVDNKVTGGDAVSITPYYEMSHGLGNVDFYLNYTSTADSKTTPSGSTTSTSGGANKSTGLGVKGNLDFASNFSFLYDVSYTMVTDYNLAGYDKAKFNFLALGAGVRFTF